MTSRDDRSELLSSARSAHVWPDSPRSEVSTMEDLEKLITDLEVTVRHLRRRAVMSKRRRLPLSVSQWTSAVLRKVFVITLTWQVLHIASLILVCYMNPEHATSIKVTYFAILFIQVLNLVVVVGAAGRLARLTLQSRLSGWFLAQSFLAAILTFAGIYMVAFKLEAHSWKDLHLNSSHDVPKVFELFVVMLHFSCSTATLCGMSQVTPNLWYNYLLTSLQMVLSFVFFASILGQLVGSAPRRTPLSDASVRSVLQNMSSNHRRSESHLDQSQNGSENPLSQPV